MEQAVFFVTSKGVRRDDLGFDFRLLGSKPLKIRDSRSNVRSTKYNAVEDEECT